MRKSIFYIGLMAALLATGASCKKTEETTKPSLSGLTIKADNKTFMPEGTVVHVNANVEDIAASDNSDAEKIGELGLVYYVTGGQRDTVTRDARKMNPEYVFETSAPGNYTLTCYVFAINDKYYSTSTSFSFTVVDPTSALSDIPPSNPIVIGDNLYNSFTTNGLLWMGDNLFGTDAGNDYENSEVLSPVFGKYYTWEEAQEACPEGWHLPSADEFDTCLGEKAGDLMVDAKFIDKKMWEYWPQVKITNLKSFNALPVGYQDYTDEENPEEGYLKYACFWTSDEAGDMGVFRYIYCEDEDIKKGQGSKTTLGMSVRCVKISD